MKKIKYFILSLIIIIILVTIVLLIMLNTKNKEKESQQQVEQEQQIEQKGYNSVTDPTKVFNITNDITSYLSIINQNNTSYFRTDENGQKVRAVENETIQNIVYNILSEEYIKQNSISKENVLQNVPKIETSTLFVPIQMEMQKKDKIETYLVKGIIEDIQYNYIDEIYVIVNYDSENNTYSIEPVNNKITNLEEIEKETEIKTIEANENNKQIETTINDQYIATQYMYMYKRLALAKPELAYEKMDAEYREKRFGNVQGFTEYVGTNKQEIQSLVLSKFIKQDQKLICRDKYDNNYIFNITGGVLDYTRTLDTYTIPSESTIQKYNSASEEEKVSMNVDRVIDMMNTRDYKNMYALLDEEYKNIHFTTVEEFEKYMKIMYNKHFSYKITQTNKEGETYILNLKLTRKEDNQDFEQIFTLMMQLKDGLDYKISFTYFNEN